MNHKNTPQQLRRRGLWHAADFVQLDRFFLGWVERKEETRNYATWNNQEKKCQNWNVRVFLMTFKRERWALALITLNGCKSFLLYGKYVNTHEVLGQKRESESFSNYLVKRVLVIMLLRSTAISCCRHAITLSFKCTCTCKHSYTSNAASELRARAQCFFPVKERRGFRV